jgi:hypothetical protein
MREIVSSLSGEASQIIRVASWPPAEWPHSRISPRTCFAANSIAAAISFPIPAMRSSGQSV